MTLFQRMLTNHPLVNILFTVVVVMGILSFATMPREQDPEISFNWIQVTTVQPGASAEDIEELVTSPLEDAIRGVQNLKFVSSQSSEGLSNILVRLEDLDERTADKRITDLRREIQAKFNDEVPEDAEDPEVIELNTSSGFPTALVVVAGQADDEVLRANARRVQLALERMKGVDRVTAFGLHKPELLVSFDPDALAARGIRATAIADLLQRGFRNTSAGSVDVGEGAWLVRVNELTESPDQLAQLEIPTGQDGQTVLLGDVAQVERARADPAQLVTFQGRPAVALGVTKVAYTNTLDLIDRITDYTGQLDQMLDANGIDVLVADDQTVQTRSALGIMERNSLIGLALVMFVCWAFLGLRIASMVTLGIIFSITGTIWALDLTGNTLNVSVLLGIVIVLGMLVDDAVVVVEAIYFRLQRAEAPLEAALGALREVGTPVTAAVLTTVSAFLPLMLLPGIVGKFMFVIPFVVTVGLLVSLVEAFWILPAHVISLGPQAVSKGRIQETRERFTRKVRLRYGKMLAWVIRRPGIAGIGGLVIVGVAGTLLASGTIRSEFFTFDPLRLFYVHLKMPPDARIEDTLNTASAIEERLNTVLLQEETRAV
ncbi:MAG: efflux RND transporter permease subunit, partial [Pseudomonadota bacterium]